MEIKDGKRYVKYGNEKKIRNKNRCDTHNNPLKLSSFSGYPYYQNFARY
jgi:hypothetical protein